LSQAGANPSTFTYDYLNRLTAVTTDSATAQYAYDGLGRRLIRSCNGLQTRYVIDPNGNLPNVIAETNSKGKAQAYYIYGLGLAYKLLPGGQTFTYHFDSRGSTIAMTNSTGRMVNKYSYGPYGERLAMIEGTHNPFGYIGRWGVMEEGDGLKFMRARFYDQTTGRFLNLDPLGFRAGVNPYVYVLNNPINLVDPLGLQAGFGYYDPGMASAAALGQVGYYGQSQPVPTDWTGVALVGGSVAMVPAVALGGPYVAAAAAAAATLVLSNPMTTAYILNSATDFISNYYVTGPPSPNIWGYLGVGLSIYNDPESYGLSNPNPNPNSSNGCK
jgi:RHS repeat-associated protein